MLGDGAGLCDGGITCELPARFGPGARADPPLAHATAQSKLMATIHVASDFICTVGRMFERGVLQKRRKFDARHTRDGYGNRLQMGGDALRSLGGFLFFLFVVF